eukprot:IDg16960t1
METCFVAPLGAAPTSAFTGKRVASCGARRVRREGLAVPMTAPVVPRVQAPQMNIIGRFFRVVRANLNQLVTGMEDPEKILNQTVSDMQGDLVKVRQAYAEVSAGLKRIERQREQASVTSAEWQKRAQFALQKGEEDLAREALTRKKSADEQVTSLERQIGATRGNVEKLYGSMQELESKINEARSKKDQFVARARTAKTSAKVNEMLSSVGTSGSLEAFDRMATKVEELEVKADVTRDLAIGGAADASLENKFKALESDSVDDELAKMKGQLSGSSPFQLPGKAADPEIEKEMERMRKNM